MAKLKVNLIFILLILFCAGLELSSAGEILNETSVSVNEEMAVSGPQTQDIQFGTKNVVNAEDNQDSMQQVKAAPPLAAGKSILNIGANSASLRMQMPNIPPTQAEAEKLGWKRKTVKTANPLSRLVKEVPKEIKEKEARLKKKKKANHSPNESPAP